VGNAVQSIANCRCSVFLDGTTVTFRANEPFVGQIAQLPPGECVGTHVQSYLGFPDFTATIQIIITP
jgi:hypothetical protein